MFEHYACCGSRDQNGADSSTPIMPTLCQYPKFGEFFEFCAALIIPLKGFSQRKLQKFFPVRLSNVPPSPATFTKCGFCKVCGYQYLALVWTRQERLKHRRAPPRQIAYCVVGRKPVARLRAEVTSRRSPKTTRLSKGPAVQSGLSKDPSLSTGSGRARLFDTVGSASRR
jgi:hypothetical protein